MQTRIKLQKNSSSSAYGDGTRLDMAYLHTETSARRTLSNAPAYPLRRKQLKDRGSLCREILKATF